MNATAGSETRLIWPALRGFYDSFSEIVYALMRAVAHADRARRQAGRKRGASVFKMMDVSRHRSVDTLRGYVGSGAPV